MLGGPAGTISVYFKKNVRLKIFVKDPAGKFSGMSHLVLLKPGGGLLSREMMQPWSDVGGMRKAVYFIIRDHLPPYSH